MTWRLTVRYDASTEVHDLADVAELRATVMRLRADPRVVAFTWLRIREPTRDACPTCRRRYWPGDVTEQVCRCGVTHYVYRCLDCQTAEVDPPQLDGCAPVPHDAEGLAIRRWRPARTQRG